MKKSLTEVLNALEDLRCKTKQSALVLCREGKIPAVQKEGRWYMDSSYIDAAVEWRKKHITLEEIKAGCVDYMGLSEEERKNCDRNIRRRLENVVGDVQIAQEGLLFSGTLYPSERAEEICGIVETCVEEHKLRQTLVPAAEAAGEMGLSVYQLKQAVRAGQVAGVRVDDDLYLKPEVVDGYRERRGKLIGVYDWLKAELPRMGIETVWDIENRTDRLLLNNMLRQSAVGTLLVSWEQAGQRGDRRNSLYFPRVFQDQVQEIVVTYLKNFGFKEELYELRRKAPYWQAHPKTMEALDRFGKTKIPQKMASLYEVFVEVQPPEIMDCNDADIDRLVEYAAARTVTHRQYLSMFLSFVQRNYNCSYTQQVLIDYQKKNSDVVIDTSPYDLEKYFLMAYMAFNDEHIKEEEIVEKALEDPRSAYCWLYTIWHYVAAWRALDIRRIPVVSLPWSREEITDCIKKGVWTKLADEASLILEHTINHVHARAHKTHKRDTGRFLTVVFPESLREIIGLAYLIVYCHSSGDTICSFKLTSADFGYLFGDSYTKIFGSSKFGNRRANKNFLDNICEIVEQESGIENRVLGYMVASYARAHSISEDGLSAVTAKYLGIKMDGMTKDEIMMALFDSGTCSFIPYMLLQIMSKDGKFGELRVADQSRIIKEAGVSAYHAEMVSRALTSSYAASKTAVDQVLQGYSEQNRARIAEKILKTVVSRRAVTTNVSTQCLLLAAGKACPFQRCTLGCRFGMHERGGLIYAIEFIREQYKGLEQAETEGERRKIRGLLEDCYIPSAVMMLTICKEQLHMDIAEYRNALLGLMSQEGEKHVVCNEEREGAPRQNALDVRGCRAC